MRNYAAAKHMKAMKKGDLGFFYHTGDEKQIVGIVEVIAEYKPDPEQTRPASSGLVDVRAVKDVPKPVTARRCEGRSMEAQGHGAGARGTPVGATQVTPEQWKHICKLGGVK